MALASDFVEEEGGPDDYDHNCTTLEMEALDSLSPCADSSPSLETARVIIHADKRSSIGDQSDSHTCHGRCCCTTGKAQRCLVEAGDATDDSTTNDSREHNAGLEFVDHHALQYGPVIAAETSLSSSNYGRESWVLQDESLSMEAQEKF